MKLPLHLNATLNGRKPGWKPFIRTRYGFCSHYAAAFVNIWCALPVFLLVSVTGYQAESWNKVGNFLEIRQADAHAWPESSGWKIKAGFHFDPQRPCTERIEQNIDIDQLVPGGIINYVPTSDAAQAAFNWKNRPSTVEQYDYNGNAGNQLWQTRINPVFILH